MQKKNILLHIFFLLVAVFFITIDGNLSTKKKN